MTIMPAADVDAAPRAVAGWSRPTRRTAALFHAKVAVHRVERAVRDIGAGVRRLPASSATGFATILGESRTPLWTDVPAGERIHQLGKVQNLRRAVRHLDGIVLPQEVAFSFWKQVGRASPRRGFVVGRMLQGGCLVPAVGGGLCQLSNAIYHVALQAGCEIVERHPHSRIVPGTPTGCDATVAWNYVDLRFRSRLPLRLEARLTRHDLVVRLLGRADARVPARQRAPAAPPASFTIDMPHSAQSCAECGETGCFRHEKSAARAQGRTAYLVDENWLEFQDYIGREHGAADVLGLPLDGVRWRLPRYRWDISGFARVEAATFPAIARALAVRRLPMQGASRRAADLRAAERIAAGLSRLLTADVTRVVVAQSLLPFLWRAGDLAGRELAVLMTRLPVGELQARLDHAAALYRERETLRDFRAPQWLTDTEAEALAYADAIVTPHREIARLFADKAVRLDWRMPVGAPVPRVAPPPRRIAFAGPTVARKGAYELRDAARALDLEIVCLGGELEGPGFWQGVKTQPAYPGWQKEVAAVVQPAIVEERPRHLLAALAAGMPVIATAACGLPDHVLLKTVPENDAAALIDALRPLLLRASLAPAGVASSRAMK